MESSLPGEDPWSQIPAEVACEILGRINDLEDLERNRRTSKSFDRLAQLCTREVDAEVKTIVPLDYFIDFRNLEVVGDNILLAVQPGYEAILSTLPRLRSANFYIGDTDEVDPAWQILHGSIALFILRQLDLDRKLPQVNFRMTGGYLNQAVGLILQGNRFTTINLPPVVAQAIMQEFPGLEYVPLPSKESGLRLLNRTMKEFFRLGEFGLVDPTRPPSEENPPFSDHLRRLADSGLTTSDLPMAIFIIYALTNGLSTNQHITPDALLDRLFREDFIRFNEESNVEPIDPDNYRYSDILYPIGMNTDIFSFVDIADYDVPRPLTDQEYAAISQVARMILRQMIALQ